MESESRVRELPLFPLDMVLFPQMLVPLHIFEERYRLLIDRCAASGEPFGIVLVTGIDEETGQSRTARVGCTARVARVERLPDGRMNIQVAGEERFRLLDQHEAQPYRTGIVAPVHDAPRAARELEGAAEETREALREYLRLQMARLGQEVGEFSLPDDPEILSFTACCVLPVENPVKQELLETTDTRHRLERTGELLRDAVGALRRQPPPSRVVFAPIALERFDPYRCRN